MLALRKRGQTLHADLLGRGPRVRASLGTRNADAARRLLHRLETALSEGPGSSLWPELRRVLPEPTYQRFAALAGVTTPIILTWPELQLKFEAFLTQRVALDKMSPATVARYRHTLAEFSCFLTLRDKSALPDIDRDLVEGFKVWRVDRARQRKYARGGTGGMALDAAILHRAFSFAKDRGLVAQNPVQLEGRPGENPTRGAQPFTGDELARLRQHAGPDRLAFLLLRWCGMRARDTVEVTWDKLDWSRHELRHITRKRRKLVVIPLHQELLAELDLERARRHPQPSDTILLNPENGRAYSRPRLYHRMLAVGRRAGGIHAHPHRFRDTLAVDMLLRGATPYDVAKILGDTVEVVERHYAPFVRELRERVRTLLHNDQGLESAAVREKKKSPTHGKPKRKGSNR